MCGSECTWIFVKSSIIIEHIFLLVGARGIGLGSGSSRGKAAFLSRGATGIRGALSLSRASNSQLAIDNGRMSRRMFGIQLNWGTGLRIDVMESVHSGKGIFPGTRVGKIVRRGY